MKYFSIGSITLLQESCAGVEFADRARLHSTHISLIERGKREARLETVEQIAQALGVQPSELMPDIKIKRVRLLDHKSD